MRRSKWDQYKFKILWNLTGNPNWGANYTPIKNVARGLPSNEIGACLGVIKDLIKKGLLWPHKKGECVSLNVKRKKEIMEFLEGFNEE